MIEQLVGRGDDVLLLIGSSALLTVVVTVRVFGYLEGMTRVHATLCYTGSPLLFLGLFSLTALLRLMISIFRPSPPILLFSLLGASGGRSVVEIGGIAPATGAAALGLGIVRLVILVPQLSVTVTRGLRTIMLRDCIILPVGYLTLFVSLAFKLGSRIAIVVAGGPLRLSPFTLYLGGIYKTVSCSPLWSACMCLVVTDILETSPVLPARERRNE